MNNYDVVIVGAGQAALPLARKLADKGRSVAIAERKHLGGSCVNFGCTPTKAVVASARVAHLARRAGEFGISVSTVKADFPRVMDRARAIVRASQEGISSSLKAHGVAVLCGHARLTGRDGSGFVLQRDGQAFRAKDVVINTGARTILPPIEELSAVEYLVSDAHLRIGQTLNSEVLSELSKGKVRAAKFILPVLIRIDLVHEDCQMFASVARQVRLRVALDI